MCCNPNGYCRWSLLEAIANFYSDVSTFWSNCEYKGFRILQSIRLANSFCWSLSVCRLVDLSVAIRYEGVEFNSCLLEKSPLRLVDPEDPDVEPTPAPADALLAPPTHLSALTAEALTVKSEFLIDL